MKTPRIYIDISVIGGCFDAEFAPWSNGLMQDFHRGLFRPVLSEVVAVKSVPLQNLFAYSTQNSSISGQNS